MKNDDSNQDVNQRRMSFGEIILTYARHPPIQVLSYLKTGRRSRRGNTMGSYVLLSMEDMAVDAGFVLKDVREVMRTVLGVTPENLSRPLTIDETMTLCDTLNLEISGVLLASKARAEARNADKEDEL